MDDHKSNRTALRFTCDGLSAGVKSGHNEFEIMIIEASLDGLSFDSTSDIGLSENQNIDLTFSDNEGYARKKVSASMAGKSILNSEEGEPCRYHIKFKSTLRPESLGGFNKYLTIPESSSKSVRQRFLLQNSLAKKDIDSLHRSILFLKTCQFQLVLITIPLLFGLLGSMITLVTTFSEPELHPALLFFPPVSVIISLILLTLFIQKTESARRATAFVMLLQRYMAFGAYPACYRGWHDSFENYNHIIKYGCAEGSPFNVRPIRERKIAGWRPMPVDVFPAFSIALFISVIFLGMVLMIALATYSNTDSLLYSVVVMVVTAFLIFFTFWFIKKHKSLKTGECSFRHLVVIFSKILKYAQPYDPYKAKPLQARHVI